MVKRGASGQEPEGFRREVRLVGLELGPRVQKGAGSDGPRELFSSRAEARGLVPGCLRWLIRACPVLAASRVRQAGRVGTGSARGGQRLACAPAARGASVPQRWCSLASALLPAEL